MSLMETKHQLLCLIAISFAVAIAGCSSERDVNIEVALDTADSSITIDGVHFSAATSMMGASKTARPPKLESDGAVKHDHVIDSSDGNFVIVDSLQDGKPLHSEIYKLDPKILSKIGNKSEWMTPNGASSDDDNLHWRLMKQPDSFKPSDPDTEYHTKMRYDVAKPYSY